MNLYVKLYQDELDEALKETTVDALSAVVGKIKEAEAEDECMVDYIRIEEGETVKWYFVNEDLTLEEMTDEETSVLESSYSDDIGELFAESGWFEELLSLEVEDLEEAYKKRVNSKGKVSRVRSRKVRSRQAYKTTGMSKSQLRRRSKKAARTRKKDTGGQRRANKKRKKAMRKRRQMGIR